MIEAAQFVEAARERGFDWYAGVPCSYLTPFINYVLQDPTLHYVSAANEGDAVALIAGATLGGKRGIAMMQNSGLGNAVSPLTSLTWTFRLPQLLIVTWRGQPGVADEPQHALMGRSRRDARHDGDPVGDVPDRPRTGRPGTRPRDRAHGRDGPPVRARDAERQRRAI
ncbi:putative phosphonopyruvate decarboxylase [Burkholderia cenocepacia]|nr:putative phosphonopyruvate decarboxylase [Burkholderia cenocepacia]